MIPVTLLLPLVPSLIEGVAAVVRAITDKHESPEEAKAALDAAAARLDVAVTKVKSVTFLTDEELAALDTPS